MMPADAMRLPLLRRIPVTCFGISLSLHLAAGAVLTLVALDGSRPPAPVIIDLQLAELPAPPARTSRNAPQHPAPPRTAVPRPGPPAAVRPLPVPVPVAPRLAAKPVAPAPAMAAPMAPVKPVAVAPAPSAPPRPDGGTAGTAPAVAPARVQLPAASAAQEESYPEQARQRYLKEQFAYIRDLLARRLVYPLQARRMNWDGRVLLSFVVQTDGSVRDARVEESSGHGLLDRSALEKVAMAAPFPRPPVSARILVPVQFRLR